LGAGGGAELKSGLLVVWGVVAAEVGTGDVVAPLGPKRLSISFNVFACVAEGAAAVVALPGDVPNISSSKF